MLIISEHGPILLLVVHNMYSPLSSALTLLALTSLSKQLIWSLYSRSYYLHSHIFPTPGGPALAFALAISVSDFCSRPLRANQSPPRHSLKYSQKCHSKTQRYNSYFIFLNFSLFSHWHQLSRNSLRGPIWSFIICFFFSLVNLIYLLLHCVLCSTQSKFL